MAVALTVRVIGALIQAQRPKPSPELPASTGSGPGAMLQADTDRILDWQAKEQRGLPVAPLQPAANAGPPPPKHAPMR